MAVVFLSFRKELKVINYNLSFFQNLNFYVFKQLNFIV